MYSKMKVTIKQTKAVMKTLGVKGITIKSLNEGMNVEMEHRDITHGNLIETAKIALAHLKEFSDYYTRLVKLEKSATKQKKKIIK